MTEAEFWATIERARGEASKAETPTLDAEALARTLEPMPTEAVADFAREYERALVALNRWPVWGAGYVLAGGMSDDSFHYFRSWIVGKGEPCFRAALEDPDSLAAFVGDAVESDGDFENEDLEYVAVELLEGRGVPDPRGEMSETDADPGGEPFDEDTVDAAYPRLAAIAE